MLNHISSIGFSCSDHAFPSYYLNAAAALLTADESLDTHGLVPDIYSADRRSDLLRRDSCAHIGKLSVLDGGRVSKADMTMDIFST
jgi:hypothetical protein